ncbi:IS21 family transposase [Candidatus Poribacteria bacterium]|jgi:transposase|nr:IS21 family transposase [Candidatus Poribacteria bacterium]
MDVRAALVLLRRGLSERQVARQLGAHRVTVKRYRVWAEAQGLLEGDLPPLEELQPLLEATLPMTQPPQNRSSVEAYEELVEQLLGDEVEIAAIWERLKERGYEGSYSSVYRCARRLQPKLPEATVRVETSPGEEAQVDFGYAGMMVDPETGRSRRTWAFVMTLSWSRHQYVEFVFDQKVSTWLLCHRNAFEWLGGVPQRLKIDNLKAAIVKACFEDPKVQHSYRMCAEHYGFLISPCRVRTPQHKGKVEQGGVHYVKRNFLGGRAPTDLHRANREVLTWCRTTAGQRIHGTTQQRPLERFEQVEGDHLQALPEGRYDEAVWAELKLHRDCHVVFDKAYYSAPYRLLGETLWVCGGLQQVRIFTADYQLVATHERVGPGQRQTHPDHLPPEKLPGLTMDRGRCREQAQAIGPATTELIGLLLDDKVVDRLGTAQRLLRLAVRTSEARLEAACERSLHYGDPSYATVKRILAEGLETSALSAPVRSPAAHAFVRSAEELVGHWAGGRSWN